MSPEEAFKVQISINTRLEAIDAAVKSSQKTTLTATQRAMLFGGLERLKNILVAYKETLTVVDEAALQLPETDRKRLRSGGSSKNEVKPIAMAIEVVVEAVEDYVDEVIAEELLEEVEVSDEVDEAVSGDDDISDDIIDEETLDVEVEAGASTTDDELLDDDSEI